MSSNIRIVLVEPSHPGNVGATARAMKNMGMSELVLVRPKQYPDAVATARASGAADLLARARVVDSIPEAIADCGLVLGTSSRPRAANWTVLDPPAAAERAVAEAAFRPVAILFGGERNIGIPFNLAAYSLLTQIIAQETNLELGFFSHTIVDAHIYVNHVDGLREQLKRTPKPLPQLVIAKKPIDELQFEDFTLIGYESYEPIKFEVAV